MAASGGIAICGVEKDVRAKFEEFLRRRKLADYQLNDEAKALAGTFQPPSVAPAKDAFVRKCGETGVRLWIFASSIGFADLQDAAIVQIFNLFAAARDTNFNSQKTTQDYPPRIFSNEVISWVWANTTDNATDKKLRDFLVLVDHYINPVSRLTSGLPDPYCAALYREPVKRPQCITESIHQGLQGWKNLGSDTFFVDEDMIEQSDSKKRRRAPT